jgi:hypothetical protein
VADCCTEFDEQVLLGEDTQVLVDGIVRKNGFHLATSMSVHSDMAEPAMVQVCVNYGNEKALAVFLSVDEAAALAATISRVCEEYKHGRS